MGKTNKEKHGMTSGTSLSTWNTQPPCITDVEFFKQVLEYAHFVKLNGLIVDIS